MPTAFSDMYDARIEPPKTATAVATRWPRIAPMVTPTADWKQKQRIKKSQW